MSSSHVGNQFRSVNQSHIKKINDNAKLSDSKQTPPSENDHDHDHEHGHNHNHGHNHGHEHNLSDNDIDPKIEQLTNDELSHANQMVQASSSSSDPSSPSISKKRKAEIESEMGAKLPTLTVPQTTTLPLPDENSLKPAAGTPEWTTWRKLNHKEVEKRRREAINTGINQLKELLPTKDENKSQIIKTAVEYIKKLKENENSNIEKWTLEKLITDQAVNELANSNEKLKLELEKVYREVEHWKKRFSQTQLELEDLKKDL